MNIQIFLGPSKSGKCFEIDSEEQSTLFECTRPAFKRFGLPLAPLDVWINQKKDGHIKTELFGEKYKAILRP